MNKWEKKIRDRIKQLKEYRKREDSWETRIHYAFLITELENLLR